MQHFNDWLADNYPEFAIDEGILDSLGKSKALRAGVAAAGLLGGAAGMKSSAANPVASSSAEDLEAASRYVRAAERTSFEEISRGELPSYDAHRRIAKALLDDIVVGDKSAEYYIVNPQDTPEYVKPFVLYHYSMIINNLRDKLGPEAERSVGNWYQKIDKLKHSTKSDLVSLIKKFDPDFSEVKAPRAWGGYFH